MKKYIILLAVFSSIALPSCNNNPSTKSTDMEEDNKRSKKIVTKMDSLNAALVNNPNNAKAFIERAEFLIKRNQLQRAANDISNALNIDSSIAKAHELKGEVHFAQNQSRQAKEEWTKCIKLDPENVSCHQKLAELYIAIHDYEKALKLINDAMAVDNKNAISYFIKGLIVRDAYQDTSLALNYFQRAIDLKQDFLEALDMMGVTLANRRDSMARFYYERILEIDPNRADTYYKLGLYYMLRDDINKALENYTRAVQLNPKDAESYFNLGYMHIELRQYAKARDYFTKAIQVREQNFKAYYGRGYAFEMVGDVINARKDYLAAIKANPIYTPAKEALDRVNKAIARPAN